MIPVMTIAGIVWLEMFRKKEFYVLLILLGVLLAALLSLDAFGLGKVAGYVKDIGLLLTWVLAWVLAVNLSTRQLPREEAQGTIFPLLAKPITRAELLAGKWLGAWTAVAFATLCFYLLLWGVIALRGSAFDRLTLAQAYALHAAALSVVVAGGLLLSTRLNHDAAATLTYVVTGLCFALLPRLAVTGFAGADWRDDLLMILYYLLPHLEVFDMRRRLVHDWGAAPPPMVLLVLLYAAVVTALLLLLAWLAYRHKRFSRGEIL
jgi:ABC-type transport system involved in multi-copper enzyme maturation permease subunit